MAQYRTLGDLAFEPRSRRPRSSPTQTPSEVVDLIVHLRDELVSQGLDGGPDTIGWHLQTHHQVKVSRSTIRRYLIKAGRIEPAPKKRPRSSYIRFEAGLPNETWQSDVTHYFLGKPDPNTQTNRAEILTWLDDHSRFALSVTAHLPVKGSTVVQTLKTAGQQHGLPASILTDKRVHLHHPVLPRRRPQRPRNLLRGQPHRPETLTPTPPNHLRQSRTFPTNNEELVESTTQPTRHGHRTPTPTHQLRRDLQPPPTPPQH